MRVAALLAGLLLCACGAGPNERGVVVPALGELNPFVLEALRAYPTDGRHAYWWPRGDPWRGTTRTLTYEGETLCAGDPEGRCYCSGLTFEVFLDAWMAWARARGRPPRVGNLDLAGLARFQDQWYGASGDRKTLRTALLEHGLGVEIADLEAARPGDFVQLWRHDGSGHSAVFLAWLRDATGAISGLTYWSTQASTRGIGQRSESLGAEGHALKRDELYVVRAGR